MQRFTLIFLLIFTFCLLAAQNATPWQYVRHSARDNNGIVHVRFNGTPDLVGSYDFYSLVNNNWFANDLDNTEPFVYEALLPYTAGQNLKYRLRASYEAAGQSVVAVNPAFLDSDTFPPLVNMLGYIADDPVGDSVSVYFPNLDLTGSWSGWSNTKIYMALSDAANSFPTSNSLTSYNLYFAGLANSTTAISDSAVYAMVYTVNLPGVISPGLYKLYINPADTSFTYQNIGAIQTQVVDGKLVMSCNIADLTADPNFGSWPPANNFMGFIAGSMRVGISLPNLTPTFGMGDLTSIAQLVFENHHYQSAANTPPVITDPELGSPYVFFVYSDAEGDFPLYAKYITDDPYLELDFTPTSLEYQFPVPMNVVNPLGTSTSRIRISDNNIDFVEYVFGTANQDESQPVKPSCRLYPNPFNPSHGNLAISVTQQKQTACKAGIYNLKGQCIRQFYAKDMTWDGCNSDGILVGNGMYVFRYQAGNQTITRKFVVVR